MRRCRCGHQESAHQTSGLFTLNRKTLKQTYRVVQRCGWVRHQFPLKAVVTREVYGVIVQSDFVLSTPCRCLNFHQQPTPRTRRR